MLVLKNPDAEISRFCSAVEEQCQAGFCSPELCNYFVENPAKESCGCESFLEN